MPDLVDEVATAARTDPGEVVVEREWQGEGQRTPDTWLEGLIAGFARKGEYVERSRRTDHIGRWRCELVEKSLRERARR